MGIVLDFHAQERFSMTIDQTPLEKASKDLMAKLTESFDQLAQSMDQLWASFYIILTELFEMIEEASKEASKED